MIRPSPKGYLAPWSARRETIGLMGTFLVFLIGLPSHSQPVIDNAKHLASQLIQLILVFLGLATPVTQAPGIAVTQPAKIAIVKRHHPAALPDPNSIFLRSDPVLHHFTYLFEGKATYHGQPCPNASVLVRLFAGDRTVAKGAVTDADGSYSFDVAIDAQDSEPVDWNMEAYTPDFKKVELAGRRIVQREEEPESEKKPIIVTNPVEFIVSLSK
jgi:hypothetical protein